MRVRPEKGDDDIPKTEKESLDKLISYLIEIPDSFYENDFVWVASGGQISPSRDTDVFVLAGFDPSKDNNRTLIEVFTYAELRNWAQKATAMLREWREDGSVDEDDWIHVVEETRPSPQRARF